ncbi:sigma-70 family RNA polymerase sigma factor [Pelagicoccus mobilis]|uniref:Sigma-70 family RNA polymerase sigma factor n=1 Tax=Pelagicoccus mobilis TaxID=415221 RepID=A0A934VPW9_9BACT|nr:sigma-70 family RNA polymerase sigma factor [Pelagicoccus mobilis]MBK1875963.1 sigma-70 family RNA polymerase sigma factor [Pelagicoccus mobilis]
MAEEDPIDDYELYVKLFTQHESQLRNFARGLVPTWHDADEIVQEVALTAWKKFDQFEVGTSFIKWVCVIARFKALSYRRKMARDRLSFGENLIELMADESIDELDQRQNEYEALELCLKNLPERQRIWVKLAYTPGITTAEVAERAGVKAGTFYMRLNRIRKALLQCITARLKGEGLA